MPCGRGRATAAAISALEARPSRHARCGGGLSHKCHRPRWLEMRSWTRLDLCIQEYADRRLTHEQQVPECLGRCRSHRLRYTRAHSCKQRRECIPCKSRCRRSRQRWTREDQSWGLLSPCSPSICTAQIRACSPEGRNCLHRSPCNLCA